MINNNLIIVSYALRDVCHEIRLKSCLFNTPENKRL